MKIDCYEEFIDVVTVDSDEEFVDVVTVNSAEKYEEKASFSDKNISPRSDLVNVKVLMKQLASGTIVVLQRLTTLEILKLTKQPEADQNVTNVLLQNSESNFTNFPTEALDKYWKSIHCGLCQKRFNTVKKLQKHMAFCGKEPDFFCQYCPYETQFQCALKNHLLRIHRIKPEALWKMLQRSDGATFNSVVRISSSIKWYCSTCDKPVNEAVLDNLTNCLECDSKLNFYCIQCQEQFGNKERAMHHSKFGCSQKCRIRCSECLYVTSAPTLFYFHMNNKHPFKPNTNILCGKCLNPFQSVQALQFHRKSCGKSSILFCHHCSLQYGNKEGLLKHLEIHEAIPDKISSLKAHDYGKGNVLQCAQCSYKTMIKRYLINHIIVMHPSDDSNNGLLDHYIRYCPNCDESESMKRRTGKRCVRCEGEYLMRCVKCNWTSETYFKMWKHLKTSCFPDSKRKQYPESDPRCPKCGVKFKHVRTCQSHLQVCGKEPNYCCDICPFKTKYSGNLTRHKSRTHAKGPGVDRLHTKSEQKGSSERSTPNDTKKNFMVRCPNCSKEKAVAQYVQKIVCYKCNCHMEFQCCSCNAKLPSREALAEHSKSHSSDNLKTCEKCNKTFALLANLKMHEKVCRYNQKA